MQFVFTQLFACGDFAKLHIYLIIIIFPGGGRITPKKIFGGVFFTKFFPRCGTGDLPRRWGQGGAFDPRKGECAMTPSTKKLFCFFLALLGNLFSGSGRRPPLMWGRRLLPGGRPKAPFVPNLF